MRVLQTECQVCAAFDITAPPTPLPPRDTFVGIWDTGATGTVITQEVVRKCGLQPIGMTQVQTAGGLVTAEEYLVNVFLMGGNINVQNIRATKAPLGPGADVLIGMDIIALGDFALTNQNGATTFSFRIPSMHTIDYQAQHQHHATQIQQPSSGSPKRKKKAGKTFGKNKKRRR